MGWPCIPKGVDKPRARGRGTVGARGWLPGRAQPVGEHGPNGSALARWPGPSTAAIIVTLRSDPRAAILGGVTFIRQEPGDVGPA